MPLVKNSKSFCEDLRDGYTILIRSKSFANCKYKLNTLVEWQPGIRRLFIEKIAREKSRKKYSRTAEQEICIYYRDIGLMDTPVEQACETEEISEEYEFMDISKTHLTA